jgi:activator of HSP90 ATPase
MPDTDRIEMSWMLNARPKEVFDHWMSTEGHSSMTGGEATVDPSVGGVFTAWDGYIQGATLASQRNRWISQSWRTADFSARRPDSKIEVRLRAHQGQTQLTLVHTNLKRGDGAKYTEGWYQFYLQPMVRYFDALNE